MEDEAEDRTISSEFNLSELKPPTFRDKLNQLHDEASSILLLSVQLKKAEDQFLTATNLIEAKANELHSIQASIGERKRQAERKNKELEGVKGLVNERLSKIEVRENEIEAKKRELEEIQEVVNERFGEIDVREKRIELKEKEIEGVEELMKEQNKEIESKRKELKGIQEFVNEKFREIEVRAKGIELKRKELEGYEELVKKRAREIESKEREVEGIEVSVKEKFWEIDLRETEIELKRKELERDGELVKKRVEGIEESLKERFSDIEVKERGIELKENELERLQETVKKRLIEVERKEMELEGIKESVKRRIGEIEVKEKELEGNKESVTGRIGEIEVKEKECNKLVSELKVKEVQVEEKSKELKLKDQRVGKRFREFLAKEKKFEDEYKEFKLKDEKVLERLKEIESKEKEIHDRCKVLELNEKIFEERSKEFRLRELKVGGQAEVLKLKENQLEERWKEVEFERKRIMDQYKELELTREFEEHGIEFGVKDKIFVNTKVEMEPKETYIAENATSSMDANLCSSLTMDGKALQMFLNEHCKGHECKSEVEVALRVSSDPAMLVLNALEGFYPPHLRKGGVEFEGAVVRNSCILLLGKLMKISPKIQPHVKKEAMKIASDWMKKMRLDAAHSLEVLGFLQLLASYGLASDFSSDKLLNYLEFISQHSQAPDLFRGLGFADKISGFIQNLIRKKQRVEAVRFIYAFDLKNKFPPGPLLKDHLNDSKITAKRMNKRDKSLETQIETANKRIADVTAVLTCIEDHKIESELSVKQLRAQIELWEKENLKRKKMLPDPGCKLLNPNEIKCSTHIGAATASTPIIEPKSACATNTNTRCSISTAASTAMPTEITAPSLTAAPISATSPTTAAAHIAPTAITSPSPTVSPIKTPLPTTTADTRLLAVVSSPVPTIAPPSVTLKVESKQQERNKRLQTQKQGGQKRPRVWETSEIPRTASFRDPDNVYPMQFPRQQPAGWFTNQGAPFLDSARHYSLNGYPSINLQLSPYYYYMPKFSRR